MLEPADPLASGRPFVLPPEGARLMSAHATLLGHRIDTAGLERPDMLSSTPLAFRVGDAGYVAIFRYGVVVMINLTPLAERDFLSGLQARVAGENARPEEERALLELTEDKEDRVPAGGNIALRSFSSDRLLLVADALAKSVALARDEHEVAHVLDLIEPFARRLAASGSSPGSRRDVIRMIGKSLQVQHRLSSRVAVDDKPDVLWERFDLERLYARLEDTYELKERAATLTRKVDFIRQTAQALTDLIDAARSLRLEIAIVLLILFEIVLNVYQMLGVRGPA
jgi:uncharacterized Rmd1/YagE family protein